MGKVNLFRMNAYFIKDYKSFKIVSYKKKFDFIYLSET